tara:strand:- start:995 stop:1243 length:249 start_codon:yes stop_codon:yes gene_type:complete
VRDAFKDFDAGSKYKKYEYLRMAVELSPLSEEKLAEIREGILKKAKLRKRNMTENQVKYRDRCLENPADIMISLGMRSPIGI